MAKKRAGKKTWGFDISYIDKRVRPQDDFYHYAVGTWLKKANIPKDESRWGSFIMLRHATDRQVRTLVNEVERLPKTAPGSPEHMVRNLYRSGMDEKRRTLLGARPMEPERKKVRSIKTTDDLQRVIAELHVAGTSSFWGSGVDQDMKNSNRYRLYLYQSGLSMPDRDYYLLDGAEQKRVRTAFIPYVEKMLALAGYAKTDAKHAVRTILTIETRLAKASMKREDARDVEKTYHPFSTAKLARHTPDIAWNAYLKRIGASGIKEVIVMQPNFLSEMERLLTDTPLEDLKTYLDWHVINGSAGALSPEFVKLSFSFYGTVLSGQKHMKPLWRRTLSVVDGVIGEQLGQLYVRKYFSKEAKKKVNAIVDDLFVAYEKRIKALDWMSPATKKKAIEKLRATTRKLGYPDRWRSYKGLVLKENDFYGNLERAALFEHRRAIRKLSKPVDRKEWFMNPQTVNAYCNHAMNEIVFPAGILQHPFFSLSADDAVNYGAMGMVIGHEMSHNFDNQGAKFDKHGNLKNWWSPKDKKRFEAKGKILIKQFDAMVVEGLHLKGKLTLGENIGDLGGLHIAYDAYQMQLARTGRKDIDGFTPEQRFFLAYAQSEHELARPEVTKLTILTNEHPPSIARVNGPLSNMQEFYEAFSVTKSDKLYRTQKERARIW